MSLCALGAEHGVGATTTTNNVAEYTGLLHGLRRAKWYSMAPLSVVGDSMVIINQQKRHLPRRKAHLLSLFQHTRRLADTTKIVGWTHHFRMNYKMAEMAANPAIDGGTSAQDELPTDR